MNILAALLEAAAHRVEAAGGLYSRLRFIEPQISRMAVMRLFHVCWTQLNREYPDKYSMDERKKVRRYDDFIGSLEKELSVVRDWGKWVPWLGKQLDVANEQTYSFLLDSFPVIIKYLRKAGIDVNKLSLEDVIGRAVEESAKLPIPPQGEVVYTMPDGWTLQKLETAEQIQSEGKTLNHCLNGHLQLYLDKVNRGETELFSLRDPRGFPHVTIEYSNIYDAKPYGGSVYKAIKQMQAKGDQYPKRHVDRLHKIVMDVFHGDFKGRRILNENFKGSNLRGVNLSGQDLSGLDFTGADLTDCVLVYTRLRSVKLIDAILIDADLRQARLEFAILTGAKLINADLREARFDNATLVGANLTDAKLGNAEMVYVQLQGADLTGANLEGTFLEGVEHDKNTKWPTGFDLKRTELTPLKY